MADGAGKLDRLARLKTLRSGMKAKAVTSADDADTLDLDILFDGEEEGAGTPPEQPVPVVETPAPPAAETEDSDPESLSAYFEALGIVPDSSKIAAVKTPPPPVAPSASALPLEPAAETDPAPESKGRDVDIRDRWADPVREDDRFLSSFAGEPAPAGNDPEAESLDSIVDSFDAAEEDEADPAAIDTPGEPDPSVDDILELDLPDDTADQEADDDAPDFDGDESDLPEFGTDIDIDAFEREIALAEEKKAAAAPAADISADIEALDDTAPEPEPMADDGGDAPLSITFDAGRAATLAQVSAQMGCSIDDIVVTAIDWYLDALFGEDGQMPEAETAE